MRRSTEPPAVRWQEVRRPPDSVRRPARLEPFEYVKNGKPMKMSYYMAPEEIYEDEESAREWARLSYDAALRSRKK